VRSGHATRWNVNSTASDSVHRVWVLSIPGFETERPLRFMTRFFQSGKPSHYFIPQKENPRTVLAHRFVKRLEGRIVHDQPPELWLFWCLRRSLRGGVPLLLARLELLFPGRLCEFPFLDSARVLRHFLFKLLAPLCSGGSAPKPPRFIALGS
jgi:hypothetical protein